MRRAELPHACLWCRETDDYPRDGVIYQPCATCVRRLNWEGAHGPNGPHPIAVGAQLEMAVAAHQQGKDAA